MLTASVGLGMVVALAAVICDRTFGISFFRRRTCHFGLDHRSQRPRTKLLVKHRNLLDILRGGSTVESPLGNEENATIEEVLYLPGLLDVHVQVSDHVRGMSTSTVQ
jgi:hypothetical protein